jgi:putative membrane protein
MHETATPSPLHVDDRLALGLLAALAVVCVATGWAPPAGRLNWALEVGPGVAGVGVLVATHRRFPMSRLVHVGVFVHVLILVYGGYYTYANTPLGEWAKQTFGFARNHYDRVGHVALGFFPAFVIREVLLRRTPLQRGGWLFFLVVSVALAIGAFWELLEWWTTLVVAGDVGTAFLGSQGDVWDAQWDMFLALVGAAVALVVGSGAHDRALERVLSRGASSTSRGAASG